MVPALQVNCTDWSAWVAPELAVMFTDTPWLDIEPVDDGQAALLRPLRPIKPAEFDAALARVRESASRAPTAAPALASARVGTGAALAHAPTASAEEPTPGDGRTHAALAPALAPAAFAHPPEDDPRRFLLRVMNDERLDMAHRIEAAKALLGR